MNLFSKLLKLALFVLVATITLLSTIFMTIVIQFVVDMIMGAMFADATGVLYGLLYFIIILPLGGVIMMPHFLAFSFLVDCAERLDGK